MMIYNGMPLSVRMREPQMEISYINHIEEAGLYNGGGSYHITVENGADKIDPNIRS